jgi:hypothetical protein
MQVIAAVQCSVDQDDSDHRLECLFKKAGHGKSSAQLGNEDRQDRGIRQINWIPHPGNSLRENQSAPQSGQHSSSISSTQSRETELSQMVEFEEEALFASSRARKIDTGHWRRAASKAA